MLAVGPDGTVYVSQPDAGQVSALPAGGGTARAVVTGLSRVHGLAVAGGQLYLATPTRVYVATLRADGGVAAPRVIADGLPAGGQHPYRTLGVGPVGRLYVSVGSTCNACVERDHASAAIVQLGLDGGGRRVFARGLRNTEAFAWHPATGAMWGMDQGADNRGANAPPEELNRLVDGGSYGWPWCYGNRQVDPVTPGNPAGTTKAAFCAGTVPMTLGYQAHSSPLQLLFYTGRQFPATYRNDAFLTLRGSWNRTPAMGYKVVRLRFNAGGEPTGFVDFLTGFLTDNGQAQFGRPCGLAQARDGSLLVGDDDGGVIYRVRYE
jgi:glucose/arabinose dehydrogenase